MNVTVFGALNRGNLTKVSINLSKIKTYENSAENLNMSWSGDTETALSRALADLDPLEAK